jgi:DNA topoisomerase-6 subunit B
MLKETEQERGPQSLYNFLQDRFCRVSAATASSLCEKVGVTSRTKVGDLDHAQSEKLFRELQEARLPPPPTDCLAPIGLRQLLAGLLKGVRAEFYAASSREPDVYRGRPFLIEAAIAFGGELAVDEPARVIRFANRVPLLYQQSACSSFKAVIDTNWRNYDLQQPRGALAIGPLVIMIHMASVWVPFTSESKEAIADYDEIRKEMKLALMECGRKLGTYLRKRASMKRQSERRDVFERYIGEISKAVSSINGTDAKKLYEVLLAQAKKRTAAADQVLDEEGKVMKDEPGSEDGVLIVAQAMEGAGGAGTVPDAPPVKLSKAEKAMLEVASRQKDEDQPKLIDTDLPKRLSRKGKPPRAPRTKVSTNSSPNAAPKAGRTQFKATTPPPGAPAPPEAAPRPSAPAPSKKPKPKMRLVGGKLIPIDEPGLF